MASAPLVGGLIAQTPPVPCSSSGRAPGKVHRPLQLPPPHPQRPCPRSPAVPHPHLLSQLSEKQAAGEAFSLATASAPGKGGRDLSAQTPQQPTFRSRALAVLRTTLSLLFLRAPRGRRPPHFAAALTGRLSLCTLFWFCDPRQRLCPDPTLPPSPHRPQPVS